MPEWSIGSVSKTEVPARVPGVRIPPSPPICPRSGARMARTASKLAWKSGLCLSCGTRAVGCGSKPPPYGKARLAQSLLLRRSAREARGQQAHRMAEVARRHPTTLLLKGGIDIGLHPTDGPAGPEPFTGFAGSKNRPAGSRYWILARPDGTRRHSPPSLLLDKPGRSNPLGIPQHHGVCPGRQIGNTNVHRPVGNHDLLHLAAHGVIHEELPCGHPGR